MSAIKKTLLEIVQDILSDIDSEPVDTISDTIEAEQIATIVEHTFYDIVALRQVPEHEGLIKLTALSDNTTPSHFQIPDNVTDISHVWYDHSSTGTSEYKRVNYVDPETFLRRTDGRTSDYLSVSDIDSGTKLRIRNNKHPEFFTSFDDNYVIMDSYDSSIDSSLQESKIRALGKTYPVFNRNSDSYVPDIDGSYFPHLISEARARAMDFYKGGVTQKAEQAARRAKVHLRNDKHRLQQANIRNDYGRKR